MSVLYSSGQLAQKAHVSKKTLRYYDEHNILKPSYVTTSGARRYNDDDLAKLQQILLLKFLGFALDDIREIIVNKDDRNCLKDSLFLQKKLIEDRIEQFQVIAESLQNTAERLEEQQIVDWNNILELIYMLGMEKSLKNQYQNASNISFRINLHNKYARNTQGWFPWIFEQCGIEGETDILEIGCGDGTFWISNREKIPLETRILVSDISAGMLSDARRSIGQNDSRFQYQVIDCHNLPFSDESFDFVIANHVLFYCEDIPRVCKEVARVLNPGGNVCL